MGIGSKEVKQNSNRADSSAFYLERGLNGTDKLDNLFPSNRTLTRVASKKFLEMSLKKTFDDGPKDSAPYLIAYI